MNEPLSASLPMYDWPHVRDATDALWEGIRELLIQHGFPAPRMIDRETDPALLWQSGNCLFSQTCGWPYISRFQKSLSLIATPVYNLEGCDSFFNRSQIVVRADDKRQALAEFKGSTVVINGRDSQSGYQAMKSTLAAATLDYPFFSKELVSGSHLSSIESVAHSHSDIACIDPVSWALAKQASPVACGKLRILCEGPRTPGLPFVCDRRFSQEFFASGFYRDLTSLFDTGLDKSTKETLMIESVAIVEHGVYEELQVLDRAATESGHATLV